MKRYFMGLDNGGTVVKAALLDETGTEVSVSARNLPLAAPAPGWAERDMEELWATTCLVIRECLVKAKVNPAQIAGLACSGHGKGLYLWGKDNKPAWNGIVSVDSRAHEYPARWEADGTAAEIFPKICQKILACQPVSLLAWFRDHKPEVLDRIQWVFEAKDYLRFRLTGEARAEITDYSGSGLMNLRTRSFDRELLASFGLERAYEWLPPLARSTSLCGRVTALAARATGLAEGTPVAGGMFDIDACTVASGVVNTDSICVVAGTWSVNMYLSTEPVLDGSVMMNSLFCLPQYYLVEESSPTSAGNYEWFTRFFLDSERREAAERRLSLYDYAENLAREVDPADCDLVFLPFLFGANFDPAGRACFAGFSPRHTRAHMIRAVLEGIAFSHRTHMDRLLAARGSRATVRMTGGATRSAEWLQIFADVLELPIETVESAEPGALGCAMAAAVAAGIYPDLAAASKAMAKPGRRVEPDPSRFDLYRKKYALYSKVAAAMGGTWKEFSLQ